jgi:hypothetical protein
MQSAFVRIRVWWTKTGSNAPAAVVQHYIENLEGVGVAGGFTNTSIAAYSSDWNTATCTRIGLVLGTGASGAAGAAVARILNIAVTRMPRGE